MDENEKKHEIEWLMGSIKRDFARINKNNIALLIFFLCVVVGFCIYLLFSNHELMSLADTVICIIIGAVLLGYGFMDYVTGKRIEKVEDARELLRIYDNNRKLYLPFLVIIVVAVLVSIYFSTVSGTKAAEILISILYGVFVGAFAGAITAEGTKKLTPWLIGCAAAVGIIILGEVFYGIFMLIIIIVTFLVRKYTGREPRNDGPKAEIEQLRELLK